MTGAAAGRLFICLSSPTITMNRIVLEQTATCANGSVSTTGSFTSCAC
ncbi:MAG TPA: hypothetical protein VE269_02450 [Gaiellaceae bacterium]|nr:hypothetical protein [Gaiellaceae bacterium]